jgi:hypothetical protein
MNLVASRRSRHTILVLAAIGLVVFAAACTPNDGPSAPTVAPTLAEATAISAAGARAMASTRA